jgi:hypothetical protein
MFGGTPQISYVKSTTDQPKWLQDAIYNQINSATTIANTPYQVYGDQRIADPTKATYDAQNLVQDNTGAWIPGMNKAMTGTEALTGQNAGVGTGLGYMQQAAGLNGVTAADPYLQQSAGLVSNAAGQKMLPGVTGYLNQAQQTSGINAAQPYLGAAGQSSANYIQDYMNPYNQAVTGQIATLGARNLQENLLPAVSDQFIRAGQFGSKGMGVFGERALRDTQEAVLGQQAQALQSGYGQAMSAAQAEAAKQLQVGQAAGTLTNAQQQALLQSGQQYGATGAQDIASQLQAAQQQQNIGQSYGTLTGQQQQNLAGIGNQYAATSGTEAQRQQSALQQLANQAQQQQGLMAGDAAGLQAVGEQQRLQGYIDPVTGQMVQGQAQLDQAYASWKEAQDYPKTQADWLNTQIRGMAPNVATSQTQAGTGYGPSVATQIAGGLAGVAGLYKMSNPV